MRRCKGHHGSSMDLLLDTITNTFGGVLFLAILVAVLLQITGYNVEQPEEPQISEAELRRLETDLSVTVSKLDGIYSKPAPMLGSMTVVSFPIRS